MTVSRLFFIVACLLATMNARAQQSEQTDHVPPDPPQHVMSDMSYRDMVSTMQMDDTVNVGKTLIDTFEWRGGGDSTVSWDAEARYGGDYDKILLRTEGDRINGATEGAHADLFWDRVVARWWTAQLGARRDFGDGPARSWAAIGIAGIAPFRFDVETTLYIGDSGRTAARVKVDYDLLLTQRLIVRPEFKTNAYGKADPERAIGSGISDIELALRLRYEFRREFAPYLGVSWKRKFGGTLSLARALALDTNELQAVVGLRLWF